MISASQLYDHVHCPHRVFLDMHGDQSQRDEPNEFVRLLWDQGLMHERELAGTLGITADLSVVPENERERETLAAMARHEPLIYSGRLTAGDCVGIPDLLQLRGDRYIPGDIKSGSGFEGEESEGKLKRHYAYQVAHYTAILETRGMSDGSREAFIIDRTGQRVPYALSEPQGVRKKQTWWGDYEVAVGEVRALVGGAPSRGALAAPCKLCHWKSHCKRTLVESDDLSLIAELGRSKRDAIATALPTVRALAACNPDDYIHGKKTAFEGIGPDTLRKYHARARLLVTPGARPYLKEPVGLPVMEREVMFDIETDPFRDVCYLHGFVERLHGQPATARYIPYFTEGLGATEEEEAFAAAWAYLAARSRDASIYYYSAYEKTIYKKLAAKYPGVCSVGDVEALCAAPNVVDLYTDVVKKKTEWPCYDQSVKTLAQYLGFRWRHPNPSGAASIEWFHSWIGTRDPRLREDILAYNEDDNLATAVVVDAIRGMER